MYSRINAVPQIFCVGLPIVPVVLPFTYGAVLGLIAFVLGAPDGITDVPRGSDGAGTR
jgi:hypothetical protein